MLNAPLLGRHREWPTLRRVVAYGALARDCRSIGAFVAPAPPRSTDLRAERSGLIPMLATATEGRSVLDFFNHIFGVRGEGYMYVFGGLGVGALLVVVLIFGVTAYFSRRFPN